MAAELPFNLNLLHMLSLLQLKFCRWLSCGQTDLPQQPRINRRADFADFVHRRTRRFLSSLAYFLTVYSSQLIKRSPNVYSNILEF
jgi:hypothetical protein